MHISRRVGGAGNLEAIHMHSQLRGETAHNMLDARVLIEAVGAQVLAVAALLEAAWFGFGFAFGFRFRLGLGLGLGLGLRLRLRLGLG